METYEIQKRKRGEFKWKTVKVFLSRELAVKYLKGKNKLDYRIFGE